MFGQLPKLFDRNFAIGYLLPVALFVAGSLGLFSGFGLSLPLPSQQDLWLNSAVFAFVAWSIAVFLLGVNRPLYQLMEGYGAYNPARLFAWREKRRYNRLLDRFRAAKQDELFDLMLEEAQQFPDEENLLPTRFGNIFRAFEVYPWLIYGIDAVEGWNRLVAVIPKDYRDLVNDAKAQTDFWLNLWILSALLGFEYIALTVYVAISDRVAGHWYMLWLLPAIYLVTFIASRGARTAAIEWGNLVKAAFDSFLPDLSRKLGFPPVSSHKDEKEMWKTFRDMFALRSEGDRAHLVQLISASDTALMGLVRDVAGRLGSNSSEMSELRSDLESIAQEIRSLREAMEEAREPTDTNNGPQ